MLPSGNHLIRYAKRPRYVREFVLVDGTGRSGKFMLGSVVSAFERMEFIQEAVLLDNLLFMHRLGKIDFESCEVLLQTEVDMLGMYMAFGRNLNGRLYDASCIYNAPEPSRFLRRALSEDREALLESVSKAGCLPIFIGHDALCNADVLFRIFPEAKMINILRHPLAVIGSWLRLGWGVRWGVDPKSLPICFVKNGNAVPWFAVDWEMDYAALSETDRVVYSVYSLAEKARAEYENCSQAARNRILFVTFEQMLHAPEEQVSRMASFLGRQPTDKMPAILARERLPRKVDPQARDRLAERIKSTASPFIDTILSRLIAEYNDYWMPLSETR